jgi:hypothetical protein
MEPKTDVERIRTRETCRALLGWADEGVCPYTDTGDE